jgi:hypothetical protein
MRDTKDQNLEFVVKTEEAWKRIEKGDTIKLSFDNCINKQ